MFFISRKLNFFHQPLIIPSFCKFALLFSSGGLQRLIFFLLMQFSAPQQTLDTSCIVPYFTWWYVSKAISTNTCKSALMWIIHIHGGGRALVMAGSFTASFSFQFKYVNIATILTSELKMSVCVHLETCFLAITWNICLTSVSRAKCGIRSTLCWKIPNISGSIELFAL